MALGSSAQTGCVFFFPLACERALYAVCIAEASVYGEAPPLDVIQKMDAIDAGTPEDRVPESSCSVLRSDNITQARNTRRS